MQGQFCPGCKSLMPPGSTRCRQCGRPAESLVTSTQSCLGSEAPRRVARAEIVQDSGAPYMPYKPREGQLEMISEIGRFLDEGRHVVVESGTGTGKTIVSLASALGHSKPLGKRIVYLVRTITQTDAAMRELRAISKVKPVSGVPITGRGKSCPLFRSTGDLESVPANVLSMMCDDRKQKSISGRAGGCRYYDRVAGEIDRIEAYCRQELPSSDELDRFCEKLGACPYEAKKMLMKRVDVVVAPYIQVTDPSIRQSFMANMDRADDPSGITIIIDGAHNFPDAARDVEGFTIDNSLVDAAIDECSTYRDPTVWMDVRLEPFIRAFKQAMRAAAVDRLGLNEKEKVLEDDVVEQSLMRRFGMSRTDLESAVSAMEDLGRARTEKLIDSGDARVSDVETLAVRLGLWCSSSSERFVRTVNAGEGGEFLRASCIDPWEITSFLNSVPSAIHMSGTLAPLDQYARVLGLRDNARLRRYPSPFPRENRLVVYDRTVTTKYTTMRSDPSMQNRIERRICDLCDAVDRNIMVFFTSYGMMRTMRPYLESHIDRPRYWEESGNQRRTSDMLTRFKAGRGGVFFAVMGGSMAEGIDYPGDELCMAVIVGIPFPPPSPELNALTSLFESRYGKDRGWDYANAVPAARKINQAIGRLIRTETDRGMAVILDSRTARFARTIEASPSDDPVADAVRFFSESAVRPERIKYVPEIEASCR